MSMVLGGMSGTGAPDRNLSLLTMLSGDDLLTSRNPPFGVFALGALLLSIPVLRLPAAVSIRRDRHCDPVTVVCPVRL